MELGTAYAKDREQFGRVIGSFQAVKHMLADGAVGVEIARAAVARAGGRAATTRAPRVHRARDGPHRGQPGRATRATEACIQVHGGMGYTWELDAHLFLKRALVLDVGFGAPEAAAERLAAAL